MAGRRSERPVILFYAREHADEHDSSWVAQGVIDYLMGNNANARAIRRRFTVLVIPLLDPDSAVKNIYKNEAIIRGFRDDPDRPVECLTYARWLTDWVDAGNRLDVVFDLHNVAPPSWPASLSLHG